ncbi:phage portal protein [Pelomonas sp. HMWF004]|nr:phage portal protein [Pelomonas sp. HMWF004]
MKFTTVPERWDMLPAGWISMGSGALAERPGRQQTQPTASLVADLPQISPENALQISTVYRCIWLISSLIASLPFFVYDEQGNGKRTLARTSRLYQLLKDSPNARMTPMEFWMAMLLNLLLRNRCYARLQRDETTGEVISMWPMAADQVESFVLDDGTMAYAYRVGNDLAILAEESVLHIKDLGNGTEGLSKLDLMRATTAEAAAAQSAANRLFSNGGKPTGVLMVDQVLKPEQRAAIRERFAEMQSGGFARLFVLEANMTYQQLSLTPEQQQLLETRKWSVEELCRWFGVPPVLAFHSNVTTWGSGVTEIVDGFHKLTIRPIAVNVEQATRKRVMTPRQRATQTAEISLDALLRGNLKDRMELYSKAVQNGIKTRNECRQLENDPPLPGGDVLTVQSNLLPIELLGRIRPTPTSGASNAD